jgi:hypothetical protein|tara:strand:- start:1075 stop:2016 length:942 start_codon:yes stop_codon:yes gene_type:complete
MAQTIKLKRSATPGSVPSTSSLSLGEVAINTYDGKMYIKKSAGGYDQVIEIGSGGGGGGSSTTLYATQIVYEYVATASQTTFSGSDVNSLTLAYDTGTPPKVQVFLNGILLNEGSSADYVATNGTSIVLNDAVSVGDLVQIAAYKSSISFVLNLDLEDNQKILLGDTDDLQIYHDGSNSYIEDAGTGNLILKSPQVEIDGNLKIAHAVVDTATVTTTATTSTQVDAFSSSEIRSCRYTIQITNSTDNTYQITEVLLIHDGTTPSMTEYGTIFTGAAIESTFDADITAGNVRLLATPASADTMIFKVVRHSITV